MSAIPVSTSFNCKLRASSYRKTVKSITTSLSLPPKTQIHQAKIAIGKLSNYIGAIPSGIDVCCTDNTYMIEIKDEILWHLSLLSMKREDQKKIQGLLSHHLHHKASPDGLSKARGQKSLLRFSCNSLCNELMSR